MYEDKNGVLWIGTQTGGLNRFERNDNKFISYKNDPADPWSLSNNQVTSICKDHSGYLWISTMGGGLNKFDSFNNKFIHYMNQPGNAGSISSDYIRIVIEDSEFKLWIGTNDAGLNIFDRSNIEFIKVTKDYKDIHGLNDNGIFSILEDNSGIIWFGTWTGGLNKFDRSKEKFRNFAHNPDDKNSLGSNEVYPIYEDKFNELWVGTGANGLDRFDKSRKKVTHYIFNRDNPGSISSNSINSICQDKKSNIWIGTDGGGLDEYERISDKFIHYKNNPENSNSIGSNHISQILCDRHGDLWIGISTGGIDRFIINKNKFIHYRNKPGDKNSIAVNLVYSLFEDTEGNIWIGTYGGGLLEYNKPTNGFIHYKHDPENLKTSLSNNVVSAIMEDENRIIWIGTNGGGINKFDPDSKEFKHYTEKDGLANDVVYGILEDNKGFLWISTGNGISRFDHTDGKFTNYNVNSGLQGNDFNQWAYFKNEKGEMYFGGNNGLTEFNPGDIKDNLHAPEVVITEFNLLHKPVSIGYDSLFGRTILEKSIVETKQIKLNYDDNIISFEVSALDFKNPLNNSYAYFLKGFDKDWTYKDFTQRYITYTNLNPGKYIFEVKGSNSDAVWNNKVTSLTIIIRHPWWATWWSYSLYAIIFILIFTGSTRFYLNRQVLKNQLALEHEHSKKLAEVDRIKSNFFTNISHEFRTPLTLIMGPSDNIINRCSDTAAKSQAEIIKRNAGRLLRLINQLLDLSKLDERKLKLHSTEGNIVSFIKGIVMSFEAFAERKDLILKIKAAKNDIKLFFDHDKMENIITNLLSNAIKFTPKGGEITVLLTERNSDCIEIKIRDTGIGIPETELPKLFDRFYQVDSSQTREYEGTGLGLSLTKELVELHHGTIKVQSEVSNPAAHKRGWTECTIELPRGRYHLNEDEILKTNEVTENHDSIELDEESLFRKNLKGVKETDDLNNEQTIILVVEDNKDVREYIRDFLVEEYVVEEAINGEQGVRKAEKIIPDLIISDVMMPKMDGNELTRILKNDEKTSHVPIILLTAKSEQESKFEGLETGADDYMTKPFDTKELLIRIKNLIETRRKLQEKFSKVELALHRTDKHLNNLDKNFLDKINAVIGKHLSEETFNIEEMGNEINMSRSQVHRKLRALTGKSPSLYMRSIRLAKAKNMIRDGAGNISEIAYSVGFSSPAYFTRCFKEEFGIPPSELNNYSHKD